MSKKQTSTPPEVEAEKATETQEAPENGADDLNPPPTNAVREQQAIFEKYQAAQAEELRLAKAEIQRLTGELEARSSEATEEIRLRGVRERELKRLMDFLIARLPAETVELAEGFETVADAAMRIISALQDRSGVTFPIVGETTEDEEAALWQRVAQAAYYFVSSFNEFEGDPQYCGDCYRILEDSIEAFGRFLAGEEKPLPLPPEATLLILTEWARRKRLRISGSAIETKEAHFRVLQGKPGDENITLVVDTPKMVALNLRDRLQRTEGKLAKASSEAKAYESAIAGGDDNPELIELRDACRAKAAGLQGEATDLRKDLCKSEAIIVPIPADLSRLAVEVR